MAQYAVLLTLCWQARALALQVDWKARPEQPIKPSFLGRRQVHYYIILVCLLV